jgi:prepilin-type N-terminal cleavage/methylation domain-containing protein
VKAEGRGGHVRPRGFTLVEILIVITILSIISMMMIPNFLRALDRARQRRTMAEMHLTGKAMMSWLTDHLAGAAAGAITTSFDMADYGSVTPWETVESILSPVYMPEVPKLDGWNHPYEYRLKHQDPEQSHTMAIRSPARDGLYSGDVYTFGGFSPTEYEQDLVWVEGFFVRWADRVE